nr:dockerin type I repeat-containing protein [uncultured Ruminococcus sp.]
MKLIKKYFIILLSILTVTGACSCVAAAAESDDINNKIVGDVDGDGLVTVLDATLIQKYTADIIGKDELNTTTADVNLDGKININDTTKIQSYAAGISDMRFLPFLLQSQMNIGVKGSPVLSGVGQYSR